MPRSLIVVVVVVAFAAVDVAVPVRERKGNEEEGKVERVARAPPSEKKKSWSTVLDPIVPCLLCLIVDSPCTVSRVQLLPSVR